MPQVSGPLEGEFCPPIMSRPLMVSLRTSCLLQALREDPALLCVGILLLVSLHLYMCVCVCMCVCYMCTHAHLFIYKNLFHTGHGVLQ